MIYNIVHRTRPVMAHAPGKIENVPAWGVLNSMVSACPLSTRLPASVSLVTFNSGGVVGHNGKETGLLERCLEKSGVQCEVLGGGVTQWRNSMKIPMLSRWLEVVRTEYVLVADSSDVFLTGRLERLPEMFDSFDCGAVFNSERRFWPEGLHGLEEFELDTGCPGFLNAGLWMARTEFAVKFMSICLSAPVPTALSGSEQAHFKFAHRLLHPATRVDHRCEMFQGLNRVPVDDLLFFKPF